MSELPISDRITNIRALLPDLVNLVHLFETKLVHRYKKISLMTVRKAKVLFTEAIKCHVEKYFSLKKDFI